MFYHIRSKYSVWYFKIIENAKSETRSKKTDYFENHHIQPASVGGKRVKENMVLLTAREHLICHRLLIRMFIKYTKEWCSMVFAFKRMIDYGTKHGSERRKIVRSYHYEERRRLHGKAMSIMMTGKRMPDHVKTIISACHKGTHLSLEHKNSISKSLKKTLSTPEQKLKISKERKSRTYSDIQRQKAKSGMKLVWQKRHSGEMVIPDTRNKNPKPKKIKHKTLRTKAQRSKATSDAMKKVWLQRRLEKSTYHLDHEDK